MYQPFGKTVETLCLVPQQGTKRSLTEVEQVFFNLNIAFFPRQ